MRRSRPISREDAIKYLDKTHPVYRFLTVFRSKPVDGHHRNNNFCIYGRGAGHHFGLIISL